MALCSVWRWRKALLDNASLGWDGAACFVYRLIVLPWFIQLALLATYTSLLLSTLPAHFNRGALFFFLNRRELFPFNASLK